MSLSAPRTRASGNLSIDLERRLVEGELTGRSEQLRALAAVAAGADSRARSSSRRAPRPADGAQEVALSARGRDLAGAFGRLGQLELRGSVADALQAPRGHRRPDADGLRAGRAGCSAGQHPRRGHSGGAERQGRRGRRGPRAFRARCPRRRHLGRAHARAHRAARRAPGRPAAAPGRPGHRHPGRRRRRGQRPEPAPRRRRASPAPSIWAPQQVAAEATLEQLPLALLGRLGAPELERPARRPPQPARGGGQSERQHPSCEATDVAVPAPAFADMPPARIALTGELTARRLRLDLRGEGVSEQPIRAQAELPLVIDLAAGAFEHPGRRPGRRQPRCRAQSCPPRRHRRARRPAPRGAAARRSESQRHGRAAGLQRHRARLDGALYENGTTGTVLRDLTLLIEADRQTLAIRRFTATDGGAGRLNGQGTIGSIARRAFRWMCACRPSAPGWCARDDATATMSGRVALEGNVAAPRLTGRDCRRPRRHLDSRAARPARRGPAGGRDRRAARRPPDCRRRRRAVGARARPRPDRRHGQSGVRARPRARFGVAGAGARRGHGGAAARERNLEPADAAASRCSAAASICAGA